MKVFAMSGLFKCPYVKVWSRTLQHAFIAEAQNLQELGRTFRFSGPLGFWVHGDVGFRVHGAEHVSRMADLDCSVKIGKSLIRFRA